MHYEKLRDLFTRALEEAGLHAFSERPTETIDLSTSRRRWSISVVAETPRAEPFSVTASIAFEWDPLDSARANTSDDDVVYELFGDRQDIPKILPRHQRIDFVLRASLPFDSKMSMPRENLWQSWSSSVAERLDPLLTNEAIESDDGDVMVMGWRGNVEIQSECRQIGGLYLTAVSVPSWQAVVLPPAREGNEVGDADAIADELEALADTYREALDTWRDCVTELATAIENP